ncbi:DUF397 domain-containing protein [Streptomyces longwoodensis]|uniref:DUF397 domain-containing protein n=1 Tax=Streptomyces longwoodensis TaxID=68231 RepID=UPI0033E3D845
MSNQLTWIRSTYSDDEGGNCVEVAVVPIAARVRDAWFKSSYSDDEGGDCVEVCPTPATVHVRDSKTPRAPHLTLPAPAWTAFVGALRTWES